MSIMQMIKELAERNPSTPTQTVYWVQEAPRCSTWHCDNKVQMPGDICEQCTQEKMQGFEVLEMTGRRANGFQRDAGRLYHAVRFSERQAVCGAKPGRRSDWSMYHGKAVTCPRCKRKVEAK